MQVKLTDIEPYSVELAEDFNKYVKKEKSLIRIQNHCKYLSYTYYNIEFRVMFVEDVIPNVEIFGYKNGKINFLYSSPDLPIFINKNAN
jgi:hypothetical protein